ncbi:DUF262 domain-containing protein [Paenibacillus sp. Marseille-P2973]|uniref:DUF262 domain-containing protein n=1 Tax=Paenibacillus sp. Marseille-P2973 TaxID=1871032 RepID=UPI001B39213D|nr:DUF262 domain-containing protein [Paenibacillus sp. Marseille-P2973]MBQ4901346.1 DUF262 domain-containing protein [Paenibacillus sp. Marseille-P2973]
MSQNVLNLFPIDYPFETLVDRVNKGSLKLNPDFQRKYKWNLENEEKTSRFIESCLMRIPLPACYFAENEEKKHIVIDGVQRITTIKRFLNDEFVLEGLTAFKELEGKRFSELGDLMEDLNSYTIRCIVLRNDNSKELVQDIFARLNQGAVELTDQEIRHAIYPGPLDDLLNELSTTSIFDEFGKKEKNGLENQEQVLRFFGMQGDLEDYESRLSKYLDKYMRENQNLSEEKVYELKKLFLETLDKCITIFEEDVFMDISKDRPRRSVVYYDLLMWSFSKYDKDFLVRNKETLNKKFEEMCSLDEFQRTLSGGLQRKTSIIKRRELWEARMGELE